MKQAEKNNWRRSSGVLLHITSLPSQFGIGDIGPSAHDWVDALSAAGIKWWQILPLGPSIYENSPYSSFSAFAGNHLLISPEELFKGGLASRTELGRCRLPSGPVNYAAVKKAKEELFARAWKRFSESSEKFSALKLSLERFKREERAWLEEYCLYMALREATGGLAWYRWPRELAFQMTAAVNKARRALQPRIDYHSFLQYLFYAQVQKLADKARRAGVHIMADLPIFVSHDSADVWSNRHLFMLDRQGALLRQSGVPPDFFSVTGQLWGNPLYRWKNHQKENFSWWERRLGLLLRYADLIRIDHFRGLEACWAVPGKHRTALYGKWMKVPGKDLLNVMRQRFSNLPFVAEDLGTITPEVERLRDYFSLPGMRVLQFAFDGNSDNPHLPCNFQKKCIVYTGTHDNDTTAGWFASMSKRRRRQVEQYLPEVRRSAPKALIREALSSVADLAIVPIQDLLELGSEARMNRPGRAAGNWKWRIEKIDRRALHEFGLLSALYGRLFF